MQNQTHSNWTYSEMVGTLLRQERNTDGTRNESVIEQLVRQLKAGASVDTLKLDLTGVISCPDCEPGMPCERCRADQAEVDREIRDHLRRVEASGMDLVAYLSEADQFHAAWQDKFHHIHMAAMGGELWC